MSMSGKIVIICGFSACGKDSITKYISDTYNYNMVISTTSRPMRVGEKQGEPYHFISRTEFENRIRADKFIEYRHYDTLVNGVPDTWYYGVSKNSIDPTKNYIVVLDMWGLSQFKEQFDNTISFFINVPDEERKNRAKAGREDFDETEWNRRLADDNAKFTPEVINEHVDFVVQNDNLERCVSNIMRKAKMKF